MKAVFVWNGRMAEPAAIKLLIDASPPKDAHDPISPLPPRARLPHGPEAPQRPDEDGAVIRLEREQHFPVPVERGFAFITDMANWPRYWPGFVRIEPGAKWSAPGDETRIVVRLLGRNVELLMTLGRFEENRLVEYESIQNGAPDVRHERHFVPAGGGFRYRIVIEYEPRAGLGGLYDRLLLRRGIERAVGQTFTNLEAVLPS